MLMYCIVIVPGQEGLSKVLLDLVWLKQETCITDFNISTRPASRTSHRAIGRVNFYCPWSLIYGLMLCL